MSQLLISIFFLSLSSAAFAAHKCKPKLLKELKMREADDARFYFGSLRGKSLDEVHLELKKEGRSKLTVRRALMPRSDRKNDLLFGYYNAPYKECEHGFGAKSCTTYWSLKSCKVEVLNSNTCKLRFEHCDWWYTPPI